jgi:hypothetical protein
VEFLLGAWLAIQDLKLLFVLGKRQEDHVFLVMLVLDTVHHDGVVVGEIKETDGLSHFATED